MDRAATNRRGRWVIVGLALVLGAWLVFDGGRALMLGDYVTPASGEYAGRLGPWANVVSALGIEPRSTLVKVVHVALGAGWLIAAVGVMRGRPWSVSAVLAFAVASLWYLPFGTIFGVIQLVLLKSVYSSRQ
jgi:hypothetical protein